MLLDPVVVTKDNVKDTVVADEFYTLDDICTADVRRRLRAAGLSDPGRRWQSADRPRRPSASRGVARA